MITRRRVLSLAAGLPLLALAARRVDAGTRYSGPVSDHFDGKRFYNPGGADPRGLLDVIRWQLGGGRSRWPERVPSPFPMDLPPRRVDDGIRTTFVGHATFLIQTAGLNVLTDPVWSSRVSPFDFAGPRRFNPPGIAFDDLPKIDVVVLSHSHYDHLDLATLGRLQRRDRPLFVTPLGVDQIVAGSERGVRATALDWGGSAAIADQVEVHLEQAHHWSARGLGDRNRTLWGAFVLSSPSGVVYFGGDTGFAEGRTFEQTASRGFQIDLALLPIGAYEPRWFMADQHMNPGEAVQAFRILGAKQALGYHWGTFQLTDEAVDAPARDLTAALSSQGVEAKRFQAAYPGQVWSVSGGSST